MKKDKISMILNVSSSKVSLEELLTYLSCAPTHKWSIGEKYAETERIATGNGVSYRKVIFCDWGEDIEDEINAILELIKRKGTKDVEISLYITMYTKKPNPWIQLTTYHTKLL